MISHQHRYIFIHQRKCAGMAIAQALGVSPKDPDFAVFNDGTLSDSDLFGHWRDRPEWTGSYHVFAVCRNPWDRFISGWRYLKPTRDLPLTPLLRDIREGRFVADENLHAHLTRPQVAILTDHEGRFVPDTLLHFERLQEDFDRLCGNLGLPPRRIPVTNTSDRRPYWTYYDAESRDLVAEIFAEDIDRFGYRFGEPATPLARACDHLSSASRRLRRRLHLSRIGRFLPGHSDDHW